MKILVLSLSAAIVALSSCSKALETPQTTSVTSTPTTPVTPVQTATEPNTIQFSGMTWYVVNSGERVGPGNNFFDSSNVFLDASGNLHLKITQDAKGFWHCASLHTKKTFGLGAYKFYVEGKLDQLDKNTVLGLFNYSGKDGFDEIDVEIAKWGLDSKSNINYTVYPSAGEPTHKTKQTALPADELYSTHEYRRNADGIDFSSAPGFVDPSVSPFTAYTFTNNYTAPFLASTTNMPLYINFWLFQSKPPSDGKETELIIHKVEVPAA